MNLTKLFETQRKLDERIVKEKGLEGQDLLPMKILALQVELGELANEWRGFKFWSEDREPRTKFYTWVNGLGQPQQGDYDPHMLVENGKFEAFFVKNPLLEEYVDCLHFILSIGIHTKMENTKAFSFKYESITNQFNELFSDIAILMQSIIGHWDKEDRYDNYQDVICEFLGLGEMLGFTWEQVEEAYYAKNQTNHERQTNGY